MLSGRIALVTGGAQGIGQAICRVFNREGARVVVADLNVDGCHQTVQVCCIVLRLPSVLLKHVYLCN